jgi:outer membrane murein-binding lipoprotein Lpp
MKERELSRANIGVAKTTAMSGRATANEINRCLRTAKERNFGRTASLTILRSLIAAGFVVTLAPMPAQADEEERGRDKKIEALEAKVESLQATVSALESQIDTLRSQLVAVQSNHALLLGPFVSVDPNPEIGVAGPNIILSGANVHIVSGSGRTDDNGNPRGLGNLIIGYDEDPDNPLTGDSGFGLPTIMQSSGFPSPLSPGDRGGSHNLVIGGGNRFTQSAFGGFVAGERNTIKSFGASICGGFFNNASGLFASVSSGGLNNASGTDASVSQRRIFELRHRPCCQRQQHRQRFFATVSGGLQNTAGGFNTVVIGGSNITDNNDNSIAPKAPPLNGSL